MTKGTSYRPEGRSFRDPATGVAIRQLTDHKAHSHHLYFTNPGWYAGGRKLLFASDRWNRSNLYGLDLADGTITQLTDLDPVPPPAETSFVFASLNPARDEAYFWHGPDLVALDLATLAERRLYRTPDGFMNNMTSTTADGRFVLTGHYADLSDRFPVDLLRGYVGFDDYWAARPRSVIVRIDTGTGRAETVFAEDHWIGHVNASPTDPGRATFCHEGPSRKVDQRIWGLDLTSGRVWPIRERRTPEERITHEYWLADGRHVAYHVLRPDGSHLFGTARHDGGGIVETLLPAGLDCKHYHSNDADRIVGDGSARAPNLVLIERDGDGFAPPRVLTRHGGSSHVQATHVHPRFSPDGRRILFVSDRSGYGNLFLADLP